MYNQYKLEPNSERSAHGECMLKETCTGLFSNSRSYGGRRTRRNPQEDRERLVRW